VLIHVVLLCLPLAGPVLHKDEIPQNRLFAVELLIPEPEGDKTKSTKTQDAPPALLFPPSPPATVVKQKKINQPTPPLKQSRRAQPREATVSLDRMSEDDVQYRSYIDHLRSKIGAVWEYPLSAREKGLNGLVTVRFSIDRKGRLAAVNVTRTSAHRLLDDEALRTIRAAAPFSPFPDEFTISTLHVLASFEYEFTNQ